jgi:hypothetical protein
MMFVLTTILLTARGTSTHSLTNNAPYLTVITTGNVFVQSNVDTVTGLYITQPKDNGGGSITGGLFTTCANGANSGDAAFIKSSCLGRLNVNGSIIAQKIYPVRAHDTLSKYINFTSSSEVFDYLPSMIVGQPDLKPLCEGAAVDLCKETESNLPPVF